MAEQLDNKNSINKVGIINELVGLIYRRINLLLCFRCTKSLKIARKVNFINTGTIKSINSYLGYIDNESVRISNKSNRS